MNSFCARIILITYLWIMYSFMMHAAEKYVMQPLENYCYDPCFFNKAVRDNQPHAVVIVAFNRPDYLAQTIHSLEQNSESESLPFYFFLDGGADAKQQENINLINASRLKYKTIIMRNRNYGCPKNHIDAKRFIFDWCGYEKVIILEEDLVVTPSFIRLNFALHTWARKRFSNVGVIQCWTYCYLSRQEKLKKLNWVENSDNYWWSFVGYCLDKEIWNAIKPTLYTFESFVDQIPLTDEWSKQRSKPSLSSVARDIRAWIKSITHEWSSPVETPGKKIFPSTSASIIKARSELTKFEPHQDIMTGLALSMAGYIKIRTIVNRACHIGKEGLTTNKNKFSKMYSTIKLDHFDEDMILNKFIEK